MGNSKQAVHNLRQMIKDQDRTYAWVSRQTQIPYKRLLAEVKNSTRPLSLETTIAVTEVLGAELPDVVAVAA